MFKKHVLEKNNNIWNDRELWQSQNFLKRQELVVNLIEKTGINRSDLVLEIGPGKGLITQQLIKKAGQVIAIEIDKKLATNLRSSFQNLSNIEIIESDFLEWQLPQKPYKVFSNIPFNMTTDIVKKLTEDKNAPQAAFLIMQDKAAFRFMGKPKKSQISILLEPWFDLEIIANINRKEFTPIPKINAVLAKFRKRENSLIESKSRQWFRDFVIYGYNQWQPTILDAFKNIFSLKQRNILEKELRIKDAKPSDLTIDQWIKLFKTFTIYVSPNKKEIIRGATEKLERQQQKLEKWHRTR